MTIYDIAKAAHVSTATVSRVINGSPNVNSATREAVLAVINQYGYQPSAIARGLSRKSMNMIGILVADCQSIYLSQAVHYLESFLKDKEFGTLLCCTGYTYEGKKNRVNFLLSKNVDAIVLVGSGYVYREDEKCDYIREAANKVPVILINAFLQHPNIYCYACDDRKAVYEATEWLYRTGSENVLFLYNQETYSGICKLAGFHEAARYYGKDWQKYSVLYPTGVHSVYSIANFLNELNKKGILFDAVITAEDYLAVGCVKYAKLNNLSIPEDFRIIGYNNSAIAEYCSPELSSVDNRLEELCRLSVDALEQVLVQHESPHNIVLSGRVITRETTNSLNESE